MNRLAAVSEAPEIGLVAALNHEGAGVIRGGKTVFVPGALPGERVRFRRTRRHRQHDDAELIEVLEASPARVAPRCVHFGVCGGCALQHMAPEAQLVAKETELRESLERLGRVQPARWLAPLRGPQWAYRRRARLGARYVFKKGRVLVGFRERAAPYVAALERCEILAPPLNALPGLLGELLSSLSVRARVPQIEVAVGEDVTALVLRTLDRLTAEDEERLRAFARLHGVRWYVQEGGPDSVRPLDPLPADERDDLVYRLTEHGVELRFSPTDFVQINAEVNRALVSGALELLGAQTDARVLDLFCGLGNFTLPLARRTAHVTGVEGDERLVARARANAAANGLANVDFHVADLAMEAPMREGWRRGPYTHVLLDPPRAGAQAVLGLIAALAPERVLYVSCHPGSLARDLATLVHEHGFRLEAAGVIDMFPHTTHVESAALLERPS